MEMNNIGEQPYTPQTPNENKPLNSTSNRRGNFLIVGVIVFMLVVGMGAYYLGIQKNIPQSAVNTSTVPITAINQDITDSKQALGSLQKALNVNSPINDYNGIDWLDQNKQRVPLMGQDFSLSMADYGNYSAQDIISLSVTEDSLKPLQSAVDNFFTSNGFQKDNSNTFRNIQKDARNNGLVFLSDLSMGYTKGELKCLIKLFPNTNPPGWFFCGIVDQIQIAWRKELNSAINTTNDPNIRVSVDRLSGNYATGSAGGGGGGVVWFAVKIDGQWKEVWSGQNTISCKPVNQYNIPKEIYGDECSTNY